MSSCASKATTVMTNILPNKIAVVIKNQARRSFSSVISSSSSSASTIPSSTSSTFHPNHHKNNISNPVLKSPHMRTTLRWHGNNHSALKNPKISLTFISTKGDHKNDPLEITVDAHIGETLLEVAHRHDIELEGACEGVCACSTCHVILDDEDEYYDELEEPTEEEEDMLDMAFGLTDTSRLGCQIEVIEQMNGVKIRVPSATRNFYVDGHVPVPH